MSDRIVAFSCGLALIAGFFLPWFDISNLQILKFAGWKTELKSLTLPDLGELKISGFDIARQNKTPMKLRFLLFLCPGTGLVLLLSSFGKPWVMGIASFVTVVGVLGYPLFFFGKMFFLTTGAGLWLVASSVFFTILVFISVLFFPDSKEKTP